MIQTQEHTQSDKQPQNEIIEKDDSIQVQQDTDQKQQSSDNDIKQQQQQQQDQQPVIEKQPTYKIEDDKQYFTININNDDNSHSCIKGNCQSMISLTQLDQRGHDEFQKYPFEPVAKYIRNKSYDDSKQVRTPEALDESLTYLKTNFLVTILNDQKKVKKISLGKVNPQNVKQIEVKQKRLTKILNIIQKQSNLQLIQQQTIDNNQTQKENEIPNQKLQTSIKQTQTQNQLKHLFLPQKILVFLQSRLAAIRCQLFAQGVIFPRLTMDLLKCQIFLYTLRQHEYTNIGDDINSYHELKSVGLDVILDQNLKEVLLSRQDFSQFYKEALMIAIFLTNKRDLMRLIQQHELILENEKLLQMFKLRLDIERGNYQKYFFTLSTSSQILLQCLLLTHLKKMRIKLCDVLTSAKIDVKKGWLAVLLGFKIKNQQANEIINISKNKEYINEKYERKQILSRQKQLKNWIKIEDLFYQLILNPNQMQEKTQQAKQISLETFLKQ